MGRIKVLDRNMINMIAAGEVIERPASIVKELMENSIDAGAKKIDVYVEDGGRKLISITDNGCGMDAKDIELAFEPHSTSKILNSSDLGRISTLGFRGEALASIASVAQVKAVSRTADSNEAMRIEIDCGEKISSSPASADVGTCLQVRDLFYKLPARRKFLRTANTEMGHISETFTRIALANPHLALTLKHNTRQVYDLSSNEPFKTRIGRLFSTDIASNLIETQSQEKDITIQAFLGMPSIARTNSKFQYCFLNGRYIRDKFITHAIKEAYRGHIETNRYPVVFVFIDMPYEDYDVNVHPTKIEVRFYNSNLLYSQILGVIREKLLSTDMDISAKLPNASDGLGKTGITEAMDDFLRKYRPGGSQRQLGFGPSTGTKGYSGQSENQGSSGIASSDDIGNNVKGFGQFDIPEHVSNYQTQKNRDNVPDVSAGISYLQIHDSYIVTETQEGFVIIDQHALHERILYEKLRQRVGTGNLESQKLLIPESLEVTEAQSAAIEENSELLQKLGVEVVPFGPRTLAIQSFPMLLLKADPVEVVSNLMDMLTDRDLAVDPERLLDEILNMAACKAAIKAGQRLSQAEISHLLSDKDITDYSSRCPHGRPTTIRFSISQLEKQFKRT